MVLDGEDDGKGRRDKGGLGDRLDDVPEMWYYIREKGSECVWILFLPEWYFSCERVTVVNDWMAIVTVPAVELNATTTG
jgi:hypothetical protein